MRKIFNLSCVLVFMLCVSQGAEAQILKKIKERTVEAVENQVNKVEEAVREQPLSKESDEKGIIILTGKENAEKELDEKGIIILTGKENVEREVDDKGIIILTGKEGGEAGNVSRLLSFKNYDFVPGDNLIYYYDMADEADAEIPGRMQIDGGSVEIQTYKGDKVLFTPGGGSLYMKPYMKGEEYLPEQFTVEFDVLSNGGVGTTTDVSEIVLYFRGKDDETGVYGSATAPIKVKLTGISGDNGDAFGFESYDHAENPRGNGHQRFPSPAVNPASNNWRHVAIYVNKTIGKLYVDQHRIGTITQIEPGRAAKLDIEVRSVEHPVLFKNFRIAAGGDDSYKKVVADGKYIAYGIQFDVNKATLKPESMGTINQFVKMMAENDDLKFEIGGHTDSDGQADWNSELSRERAEAVKAQMISMGIAENRLSTKGYGPTRPLAENNSSEDKARNRRVEFMKVP